MTTTLSILIPVLTFAAGYLLRGWLAVLWERKRQQQQQDTGMAGRLAKSMPEIFTSRKTT